MGEMRDMKITPEDFKREVIDYQGKVLVMFTAEGCEPCQLLKEKVAEHIPDTKLYIISVDDNKEVSILMRIGATPTLIMFNNGKVRGTDKDRIIGNVSVKTLMEWNKKWG